MDLFSFGCIGGSEIRIIFQLVEGTWRWICEGWVILLSVRTCTDPRDK